MPRQTSKRDSKECLHSNIRSQSSIMAQFSLLIPFLAHLPPNKPKHLTIKRAVQSVTKNRSTWHRFTRSLSIWSAAAQVSSSSKHHLQSQRAASQKFTGHRQHRHHLLHLSWAGIDQCPRADRLLTARESTTPSSQHSSHDRERPLSLIYILTSHNYHPNQLEVSRKMRWRIMTYWH